MSRITPSLEIPNGKSKQLIYEIISDLEIQYPNIIVTRGSQKGDNYMSEIFRIQIEGESDQFHFILKINLPTVVIRDKLDIHKMFQREIFVYSELLPKLYQLQEDLRIGDDEKFGIIKLYKSCSEEQSEMLIMEDLSAKGFGMYDRHNAFDFSHASLCVKTLARFHASTIALKDKNPALYLKAKDHSVHINQLGDCFKSLVDSSKPIVLQEFEGESYYEKIVEFYEGMYDELQMLMDSKHAAPYGIIVHGDCWNNNFLFKYNDETVVDMRIVDWQMTRESSPICDLSTTLFLSSDKKLRSNHFYELLDIYYKYLSLNVSKMGIDIDKYYPEHIYRDQLKKFMRFGLIVATTGMAFLLGNKGEAVDISGVMSNKVNVALNDRSKKRLRDLLEDCIEYGYL